MEGWFAKLDAGDVEAGAAAVRDGSADAPADWPALAVENGFAPDRETYYGQLREATRLAARRAARKRERGGDRQLIHAVRAVDDCEAQANELAERVAEWAASRYDDAGTGVEYARELADREPESVGDRRLIELAKRAVDLDREAGLLREHVRERASEVAPNLAELAGPVLAARLISLAGGLETLAKKPSGTVQVLGAEDALFAHLSGGAPSPKHGVIFTHEYVRETRPDERGSAARALAGKLTIAARIDHYSGDLRPALARELDERIERIRARDRS